MDESVDLVVVVVSAIVIAIADNPFLRIHQQA
jgi:hypothetical protein